MAELAGLGRVRAWGWVRQGLMWRRRVRMRGLGRDETGEGEERDGVGQDDQGMDVSYSEEQNEKWRGGKTRRREEGREGNG